MMLGSARSHHTAAVSRAVTPHCSTACYVLTVKDEAMIALSEER